MAILWLWIIILVQRWKCGRKFCFHKLNYKFHQVYFEQGSFARSCLTSSFWISQCMKNNHHRLFILLRIPVEDTPNHCHRVLWYEYRRQDIEGNQLVQQWDWVVPVGRLFGCYQLSSCPRYRSTVHRLTTRNQTRNLYGNNGRSNDQTFRCFSPQVSGVAISVSSVTSSTNDVVGRKYATLYFATLYKLLSRTTWYVLSRSVVKTNGTSTTKNGFVNQIALHPPLLNSTSCVGRWSTYQFSSVVTSSSTSAFMASSPQLAWFAMDKNTKSDLALAMSAGSGLKRIFTVGSNNIRWIVRTPKNCQQENRNEVNNHDELQRRQ